jgi:tetratricopeptide (TPR) repeat protein/transcriptional regulator with XRE-family HTH domain
MSNRSDTFARLLKGAINSIATYEGKTAPVIEEELAQKVNLAGSAIQRYKAGHLPPEARMVEIIAEAAVQRAYLHREWLQRFLHAARYHEAEKLLDRLCPIGPARPRPPRVYQNLPAPTYSQFVMREQAFADVLDGLQQRSAAVLVVGMGGNGKTSLAREIAHHCLQNADLVLFDAAVWVSDKDRPGTTNLSTVLDEIARTLDYPGFTQFEHDEKRREVEQLLRRQRVLLIVDNFETITDGSLITWLLRLPEPSKALITSREYRREWRSSWPVELRGMSEEEIRVLIGQRLRQLRIEKLIGNLDQLEPLIAATGGNPKAIEITLGLVKHERRSLQHVVDDLYAARGDLFEDLFARSWSLLDDAARRVLMVATFFPTSANSEALRATADIQGYTFDRVVERLTDLALLDVQQADLNSLPPYALHPLVRAFAKARLWEQPGLENRARLQWISYFEALLNGIPGDKSPEKLQILESYSTTILSFLKWAYNQQQWEQYLQLYIATKELLNIISLHSARIVYPKWAADAAKHRGKHEFQIRSLLQVVRLYIYIEETEKAGQIFRQAEDVYNAVKLDHHAQNIVERRFGIAKVLLLMYTEQVPLAHSLILKLLPGAQDVEHSLELSYYLALSLHKLGRNNEASSILNHILANNEPSFDQMLICRTYTTLIEIHLVTGEIIEAKPLVERSIATAVQLRDRYQIARARKNQGRLLIFQGDFAEARVCLAEALDLFERIGVRRELAEAREELRKLEAMSEEPND